MEDIKAYIFFGCDGFNAKTCCDDDKSSNYQMNVSADYGPRFNVFICVTAMIIKVDLTRALDPCYDPRGPSDGFPVVRYWCTDGVRRSVDAAIVGEPPDSTLRWIRSVLLTSRAQLGLLGKSCNNSLSFRF